jgi:5-methylcytosine-specific restriction endonuclease McrA
MARRRNTDVNGTSFDPATIQKVWEKGVPLQGRDKNEYRFDACFNKLHRQSYGKETDMGWEIDHKKPVAKGGNDDLSNLQPLKSSVNAQKGDTYPWKCP